MPQFTWTLTDVDSRTYVDEISLSGSDLPPAARDCKIVKRRLRGGLSDGVDVIEVSNGAFHFTVLPTRGMGIWKAGCDGLELGWKAPVAGPVHPAFVPIWEPSGIGWLNGFDELLCRCGLESNGAPEWDETGKLKYPLHGKIANLPARKVTVAVDPASGEISITGVVDESRLFHHKLRLTSIVSMLPGQLGLKIVDEVANLSAESAGMELLYHINFGSPLVEAGSKFVAPLKTVVPRNARAAEGISSWDSYPEPTAGYAEQVYFLELLKDSAGRSETLLRNAHGNLGVSVASDLPHFTLWKSTQPAQDGTVTGLEPGTNFPNPRSFEKQHDRVLDLAPGAKRRFEIELTAHPNAKSVAEAEARIAKLQGNAKPTIHSQPQATWCAS